MARKLKIQDLAEFTSRDEWLGFGYIGGRESALWEGDAEAPARPWAVAAADTFLVAEANRRGWSLEDLFRFANAKLGRWFADVTLGGGDLADARTLRQATDLLDAWDRLPDGEEE